MSRQPEVKCLTLAFLFRRHGPAGLLGNRTPNCFHLLLGDEPTGLSEEELRYAVGTLGSVVALAVDGAVELPDAARVVVDPVNLRTLGVEAEGQRVEDVSHETTVICWEVNLVQEVVAVATVSDDGICPALSLEVLSNRPHYLPGGFTLILCSRGIGRSCGVDIYGQPPPCRDVVIGCGLSLLGHLDDVLSPREELLLHWIERQVHAACVFETQLVGDVCHAFMVVEVPRLDVRLPLVLTADSKGSKLCDVPWTYQGAYGSEDRVLVCGHLVNRLIGHSSSPRSSRFSALGRVGVVVSIPFHPA